MRMLVTCIHEQLFEHLPAQAVLRKHPLDGTLHDQLRTTLDQILRDFNFLSARITRYVLVLLLIQLVAGELHLFCIDDYHEISAINMGGIVGFVLSAQYGGDFATDPAHSLIGPVHNVPVTLYGSCIGVLGGKM